MTAVGKKRSGPAVSKKRRRDGNWRNLEYPVEGFGKGGDWKRRASSGEVTAYEIDTERGIVRRRGGEVISTHKNAHEYISIYFSVPEKKGFQMHSLVCWAAHGPMPSGCTSVDHIDRDPTNNAASNLRWASAKDQAANKGAKVQRAMLPFVQAPGENLYEFRGFPGFVYSGPSLVITSLCRVVRNGKLSTAESLIGGGYPVIGVKGLGSACLTHRIAWSAYHGPDAAVPKLINHRDGNKKNFAMANLEESDNSHNGFAAHDTGAHDGGKSQRQPVVLRLAPSETGDVWLYDGVNAAEFPSQLAAARALVAAGVCALANVQGTISLCLSKKWSFTVLVDGVATKAWAFRVFSATGRAGTGASEIPCTTPGRAAYSGPSTP